MTEKGRESHAAGPGFLTVGWELRTTTFRFSCGLKVPETQTETTKVTERKGEKDRENRHTHTHTHTHTHGWRKGYTKRLVRRKL